MRILVLGSGAREHALGWRLSPRTRRRPRHLRARQRRDRPDHRRPRRSTSWTPTAVIRLVDQRTDRSDRRRARSAAGRGLADRSTPKAGRSSARRAAAQLETSKAFAKDFMPRHARADRALPRVHLRRRCAAAIRSRRVRRRAGRQSRRAGGRQRRGRRARSRDGRSRGATPRWSTGASATPARASSSKSCCTGPEVSFFVIADGEQYVPLLSAQDHKRIFDDDRGPNTGGMGAFSPSPLMNAALQSRIERDIVAAGAERAWPPKAIRSAAFSIAA